MFERFRDERAIEGMPIRLVIAIVVGVASLSVMMNMIPSGFGVSELDVQPEPDVVSPGSESVTVTVVDNKGRPVANATVVAMSGTATLNQTRTATTGPDGRATLSIDPSLGPNQREGTVTLDVKPPGGGYRDNRENMAISVIRNYDG